MVSTDEGVYPPIAGWIPKGESQKYREQITTEREAHAGVPGSPLSALAVKDEARRSGGRRDEGMKEVK